MTNIVKESGCRENSGVVLGEVSALGIKKRQPCYAQAVVVAFGPEPGLDAVDRSQEADPPEPLDGTGSYQLPKERILEQRRRGPRPFPWAGD